MKKALGSLIALALILVPMNAIAAVKAGDACKKAGTTATANGKKFTCIKSGKKLAWNKGAAIAKPVPAVTPAPSPSSSPTPTQSQIPSVSLPDSWSLDKAADENLVLIADASVRKYTQDATNLPKINLMTGPKTDRIAATNYLRFLEKAAIGWGKDWMPDQVDIAMAQVDDFDWIKPLWKQYGLDGGGFDNSESTWRRFGADCNQGSAIYDKLPFFWGCLPKSQSNFIGLNKFAPHEYTHLVQNGIIYHQSGKKVRNFPYLLSEGSADFYGVTYASTPETLKLNWKTYWADGYISASAKSALKSASNEEIESLLIDAMKSGTKAPGHWNWTGAYLTARLVAAKGHEGFVAYMRKTGETGDPFKAFEIIYGITFEKLTQIVAPEIKNLALNLRG
jgi:hypothetical protein